MFSQLRTEKFYGKKIKLKDIHSRNLTRIVPNLLIPRENKQQQIFASYSQVKLSSVFLLSLN